MDLSNQSAAGRSSEPPTGVQNITEDGLGREIVGPQGGNSPIRLTSGCLGKSAEKWLRWLNFEFQPSVMY